MSDPLPHSTPREDIGEILGYIEVFADRKMELVKLNAYEKIARLTSSLISMIVLFMIACLFLILLSVATAHLLHEQLGWSYSGSYFLIAGVHLLLGFGVYGLRHRLFTNPILNSFLNEY